MKLGDKSGMSSSANTFRSVSSRMAIVGVALALLLSGCGGASGGRNTPSAGVANTGPAPVQLGGAPISGAGAGTRVSVLGPLDESLVRKSIENYRISKNRAKGPYRLVGADLNGNGSREAIVLFQGEDWCTRTGCSMAVFQSFKHGYRVISRTVRVKPPVEIASVMTNAYHDILVQTGGGPVPERRVRLKFTGEAYTRNAMLEAEVPLGSVVSTQIAIDTVTPPSSTTTAGKATRQPSAPTR
jgi:hypothetical protein